jgi:hypothetical protein
VFQVHRALVGVGDELGGGGGVEDDIGAGGGGDLVAELIGQGPAEEVDDDVVVPLPRTLPFRAVLGSGVSRASMAARINAASSAEPNRSVWADRRSCPRT